MLVVFVLQFGFFFLTKAAKCPYFLRRDTDKQRQIRKNKLCIVLHANSNQNTIKNQFDKLFVIFFFILVADAVFEVVKYSLQSVYRRIHEEPGKSSWHDDIQVALID